MLEMPVNQFENRIVIKGVHKIGIQDSELPKGTEQLLCKSLGYVPSKKPKNSNILQSWKDFERNVILRSHFGTNNNNHLKHNLQNKISLKSNWTPDEFYPQTEKYLYNMKRHLSNILDLHHSSSKSYKPNISSKESNTLQNLINATKKQKLVIKNTDKNVGPSAMGNNWYFGECNRLLSASHTYLKLSEEEKINIINEAKFILQHLCDKYKNLLPPKEKEYVLSKIDDFAVPLFYILAKVHKNPIVGRPICAGHSWILTPASQVCGTYLQPFLKLYWKIPNHLSIL